MAETLKILMLEDSATDAEIIERLLKKEKQHFEFRLAMNKDAFLLALDQFQPDLILSDNALPQFNATDALAIINQRAINIPFILVTGTTSDEFAANIIKSGADDYILKDRLTRLPAAIDAALKRRKAEKEVVFQNEEKEKRAAELTIANKELRKAEEELTEKEFFLRESQRAGNIGSYKTNFVTGYWQSSETLDSILGIDKNYDRNIEGWLDIVHPDDKQEMDEYLRLEVIGKRKSFNKEYRIKKINDKQTKWVCEMGDLKFDDSGNVTELIGTIQDITERKQAEEDLAELNQFNKQIIQGAQDGIIVYDLNMRYLAWNPYMEKITGMPASQVLGKHPSDLFPFLQAAGVIESIKKTLAGEIVITPDFYFNIPGTELLGWAFDTNAPLKNSKGEIIGVIGVVHDITERKNAEESTLKERDLSDSIINSLPGIFYLFDETGKILRWNKNFKTISGYSTAEINKLHPLDLFDADVKQLLSNTIAEAFTKGMADVEAPILTKTKEKIPYYFNGWRVIYEGNPCLIGLGIDITERKKAEEKLKESNERYKFVNKATQDTIWEWDFITKEGRWGDGIIKTFGYSKDKLKYGENWLEEYVHPYDKEDIRRKIQTCIESGIENWQDEYRFRCADGTYKYVFDRGYILYDENKKPHRMIGAMTDLTEKKRLESELAEQQIEQQKLITEVTIQSQEKEKNQLGIELHDNINQILATVKMYLGLAKSKPQTEEDLVGKSYDHVTEAMEAIRLLSHSLVAPSLGDIGLKEALEELAEELNRGSSMKIEINVDEKLSTINIDKNKELMLYRIVQGQLSNILKYSKAKQTLITLKVIKNNDLLLSITDNGVGFDVTKKNQGIGLKNIANRVDFYSGKMNIISTPGKGCTLEIEIPV